MLGCAKHCGGECWEQVLLQLLGLCEPKAGAGAEGEVASLSTPLAVVTGSAAPALREVSLAVVTRQSGSAFLVTLIVSVWPSSVNGTCGLPRSPWCPLGPCFGSGSLRDRVTESAPRGSGVYLTPNSGDSRDLDRQEEGVAVHSFPRAAPPSGPEFLPISLSARVSLAPAPAPV